MNVASHLLVVLSLTALPACGGGLFYLDRHPPRAPAALPEARARVAVDRAWREASDVPHVSVFYDALAPYGVWEEDPALGWIWSPSDEAFLPYARGRWVETEAGPTFLADEPFGWAVSHYGRWLWRERWLWVPSTRWGPAWVAWRVSPEHVGWRALAPEGWSRPLPDAAWRFVAARALLGPSITGRSYGLRDVPWLVASSRPHVDDAPGFVVGPEVRFAGWRAHKVELGRLPPGQLRWVPRWQRPHVRRPPPPVRVGPAAPERRARKGPSGD